LEEGVDVALKSPSGCLSLNPFMLDGVEIWRVRGQVFQLVFCLLKLSLHGRAFMERCVVHYNHALGWQSRQQILLDPGGENFRVDIPIEGTQGQQGCSQHNVCSSSSSPNKKTKTPVPLAGIAIKSGHIVGKATFVNVHNGPCLLLIGTYSFAGSKPDPF